MVQPSRRDILAAGSALLTASALPACASKEKTMAESDDRDSALRELLELNRTKHPRYGRGLANHLSMALLSQHSLGASVARMREFAAKYSAMLDPLPTSGPAIDAANWRQSLGHDEALHGLVVFFLRDLRERGRDAVLRDALEVLAPSLGSAAFHCLIRTAFGVRFDDDAEIAHGLSYWTITAESLGALTPSEPRERDPAVLLERIRCESELANASIAGNLISERMQQASRLPAFAPIVGALEVDRRTLELFAREMLALFASSGNFTALHALTSTHALRLLLPFAGDPESLRRYHWQALTAAFIGIGSPRARELDLRATPEWSAIAARAIASNDDHDAKLVFACREEQALHGGDLYRYAAALRVKLVP